MTFVQNRPDYSGHFVGCGDYGFMLTSPLFYLFGKPFERTVLFECAQDNPATMYQQCPQVPVTSFGHALVDYFVPLA